MSKITDGLLYMTGSVMHYDAFAFAKDPNRPTIETKNKISGQLGQRQGFSDVIEIFHNSNFPLLIITNNPQFQIDLMKLNKLYECNESRGKTITSTNPPSETTKQPGIKSNPLSGGI